MVAQGVVEIRRFQHHLVFLRAHAAGDGAWDPAAHPVRGVGRPDTREILHPSGGGGVYDGDPPFTHHRRGADDEPSVSSAITSPKFTMRSKAVPGTSSGT